MARVKKLYLNGTSYDIGSDYDVAASSTAGIVKLGSDTEQSVAANAVSAEAGKTYAVQLNSSDQMVVNVPWTDTTPDTATSSVAGVVKLASDTVQSTAANAVSSDANRTYGIQLNGSNQAVVNVPWTDTTYTASSFDIKDLTDSTGLRTTWSGKQDALSEVTKSDMDTGTSTTAGKVSAKSIADYVKGMVASGVTYKGQVANYDALPASPSIGDMYNVVAKHTTNPKFDAGTNVVWNGTSWDPMAEMVDLSNLVDLTTAQTIGWVKTFSDEPVLPSKTTDATNDGTKPATEAQVYSVAQAIPTVNNATFTVYQGNTSTTKGTFTANAGTDTSVTLNTFYVMDQDSYDAVTGASSDGNIYFVYETPASGD